MGSSDRSRRGSENQAAGKLLEQRVQAQLVLGVARGLVAWWHHTQPTWRKLGDRFLPVAAGVADFTGQLVGGLAFALEVKSYAGTDLRYLRSGISDAQQAHLEACTRGGGLGLLVVQFRAAVGWPVFGVPWQLAPWAVARSAPSLAAVDLANAGWLLGGGPLLPPYLTNCGRCQRLLPAHAINAGATGCCAPGVLP